MIFPRLDFAELSAAVLGFASLVLFGSTAFSQGGATLTGTRNVWHVVELSFQHDAVLAEGGTPNPFFDFRLDVTFTHVDSGASFLVPGFFDVNGDAADSGFTSGDVWRVRFVPDSPGTWDWSASFRTGTGVAVDDDRLAGLAASFDGDTGSFLVHPPNPNAPGLRAKGMLRYEGERLLRFAWNQEYFLKGGADSPENLLGYWEFDGTTDMGGNPNDLDQIDGLHRFASHAADFDTLGGGPTWKGGLGKALLGGISYLASVGVNSIYFLTYNIDGGDGEEVFPWAAPTSKLRYDTSKLAQWERVFDHMTESGLSMHLVLQETENDQVLDFGLLGDQRKLYHRELIARFACNLGLIWNLGEETSVSDVNRKAFASHIRALDPYDHPIAVHTTPTEVNSVYTPLLGFPDVELCSLQSDPENVHGFTLDWIEQSANAGRPWVVTSDEQNPAGEGVVPDFVDPDHYTIRRDVLWGNLLGAGGGVEYYFGYQWTDNDLDCEDWRTRTKMWDQTELALSFLRNEVDYAEMRAADELTTLAEHYCLALEGEVYVVYAPNAVAPALDLKASTDSFAVTWLNVRAGGDLEVGEVALVTGPGVVSLGAPPAGGLDWVALVRKVAQRKPVITSHSAVVTEENDLVSLLVELHAEDPDGPSDLNVAGMFLIDRQGRNAGLYALPYVSGDLFALYSTNVSGLDAGTWTYVAGILDQGNLFALASGTFVVP